MKLLLIHSDYIEYEVKDKAIKTPEEITKQGDRMEEALTVFIAVETVDEDNPVQAVTDAAAEITKTAEQLQVQNIMLYPYAHLSSDLAGPKNAQQILVGLETHLQDTTSYEVKRSPFGWYKAFKISCKGHPLSELSREIVPVDASEKNKAVEKEKEMKSEWCILTPEGELVPADDFDFKGHPELKEFYEYESHGSRKSTGEPPHVKIMQSHELVDYEPASDAGHFRWYPKGRLIKELMENHVNNIVRDYGGMQVETPLMYDINHPALNAYLNKFPARQYRINSDNRKLFLRFAACFGQYMMMKDMTISYRHLPLRLYELTHYSFRREQSGEVSGLKRLRCFTMPDMHTLCADLDQATGEFKDQFTAAKGWMDDLELNYEVAIRFVREFYEKNKEFARSLAQKAGKPILLELWDERYFYFVMKYEFNIIDSMHKASALSTVQIDVENAERFGIEYIDANGESKAPYILHASFSGSIDRCMYALLEQQAIRRDRLGEKPLFPFWLAPTQIRLIPVNAEYIKDCETFIEEFNKLSSHHHFRIDIDDRDESIGKRIRQAEKEWTPVIIVFGDNERDGGSYTPRFRSSSLTTSTKESYTLEELHQTLFPIVERFPTRQIALPVKLSARPKFK